MSKSRRSLIIVKHGSYLRFSWLLFLLLVVVPLVVVLLACCLLQCGSVARRGRLSSAPSAVQTCIQLQCILLSLPAVYAAVCVWVSVCV